MRKDKQTVAVAVFPGSIDPLMLPGDPPGLCLYYLCARDTREYAWASSFLPAARILPYTFKDKGTRLSDLNTEGILLRSDIAAVLRQRRIGFLLITHRSSPGILSWGERARVSLISTDFHQQRNFEDKIWFDRFLRKHQIPVPAGVYLRSVSPGRLRLPWTGRTVLQVPSSFGSAGTFFVDRARDLPDLIANEACLRKGALLARRFVKGRTYGISVFISANQVAISALRQQCFLKDHSLVHQPLFLGIQWVPDSWLSTTARAAVEDVFLQIGKVLHAKRFFGFANFDFLLTEEDRVLVLECNPRLSSATPQLIKFPELISHVPVGEIFLREFVSPGVYDRSPVLCGLPSTSFAGALLDIPRLSSQFPASGQKDLFPGWRNGLYRVDKKELKVRWAGGDIRKFSDSQPQLVATSEHELQTPPPKGGTVASLITNFALFSRRGKLNRLGSVLRLKFGYPV